MRLRFYDVFAIVACAFLASCSTMSVEQEVVRQFFQLKEAGQLPGFAPNDHGNLRTQGLPAGQRVGYPLSLAIHATRENDASRYIYTFGKKSAASKWRLTEALRVSREGEREYLSVR